MHPTVQLQMQGETLPQQEVKIEYLLKSKNGRTVMSFDENSEVRAKEEASRRGLKLYRQTIICEQLS